MKEIIKTIAEYFGENIDTDGGFSHKISFQGNEYRLRVEYVDNDKETATMSFSYPHMLIRLGSSYTVRDFTFEGAMNWINQTLVYEAAYRK